MLHDPARHEPLQATAWDEGRVREAIEQIVQRTEAEALPQGGWRLHPLDTNPGTDPAAGLSALYDGALGVCWALQHLQAVGAARLQRDWGGQAERLLSRIRTELETSSETNRASYLIGETAWHLWRHGMEPGDAAADELARLVAGNTGHPTRDLMWGSPGTLLAALFMHQRTGQERWARLFRAGAAQLWADLQVSDEFGCAYWTQEMYGHRSTYLDAVHGFVANAFVLGRGRHLLDAADWVAWMACIENTVSRTATWDGGQANWRAWLTPPSSKPMLMQMCHGAPGFVICLGDWPGGTLDVLLLAAGEAIWSAGPLKKGANLCHGTGGNGYAFLKLHRRTGDARWLQRARAFAMHGIAQVQAHTAQYSQGRHSLWTGDPGFAIYLWHCLHGQAAFPTLDFFYEGVLPDAATE